MIARAEAETRVSASFASKPLRWARPGLADARLPTAGRSSGSRTRTSAATTSALTGLGIDSRWGCCNCSELVQGRLQVLDDLRCDQFWSEQVAGFLY
jgi:hypothetical protein